MPGIVKFRDMEKEAANALRTKSPAKMEEALTSLHEKLGSLVAAEAGPDVERGIKDFILYDFEKTLVDNGIKNGRVAEIGGPHNSFANKLGRYDFNFLSIYREKDDPRVWPADITYCPQVPDETFDAIFSVSVMEHVARPTEAAREMTRMLKPNGIVYHVAPFSYFFHGAPMDFWRYTPEAFKVLFSSLDCLKAEFYGINRRRNNLGSAHNAVDRDGGAAFSPDAFGGWRENWSTIFAGRKSEKALADLKQRRNHQLVVDIVAAMSEGGVPEEKLYETAQHASTFVRVDAGGDPRRYVKAGKPLMLARGIKHLWRQKRRIGLLPTPNRYALAKLLADVLDKARSA